MKTASEVAKEITIFVEQHMSVGPLNWYSECEPFIAQALTAFAEERVKEAIVKEYEGDQSHVAQIEQDAYAKGRAEGLIEGLEEAAKVMQSLLSHHSHRFDGGLTICSAPEFSGTCPLEAIRALKEKP